MDARIQNLSYSSLLTLHDCPRKFQLYRLQSKADEVDDGGSSNVTFAFGHIVGEGIQAALENKTEQEIFFQMFLGWHADLEDRNEKQVKSFYHAIAAVQKFLSMRAVGLLQDYELVYYNGKPAVELSFRITFPDGFKYRGFVDAVLQHKISGEVLVLECKTTSATNLNPAQYKNSAQAIGYSVVLDVIFPELSSYKVLYLVYKTKSMEYESLPFNKSYLQRALWIQELLLDIETIKMYEEASIYPMRGESCFSFYRECEYLNLCTLSTQHLVTEYVEPEKVEEFMIELSLSDLINSQLSKTEVQEELAELNEYNVKDEVL